MPIRKSALDLDARRELFELISRFPGLHLREIIRRVGMSPSNASYHIQYLVKRDIIVEVADGKLKRYYLKGKIDHTEKMILSVLRNEISRGIVLFLLLNPNMLYHDIMDNFDLEPSRLSYYLKKLVDSGIVSQIKEGRSHRYSIVDPELVAKVLITYRPSFLDALVDSFVDSWENR